MRGNGKRRKRRGKNKKERENEKRGERAQQVGSAFAWRWSIS